MALCSICSSFSLNPLRYGDFSHHRSLTALKSSAAVGCEFCQLMWACLIDNNKEDVIAQLLSTADYSAIEIQGNLRGYSKRTRYFNELRVQCGESGIQSCWGWLQLFTKRGAPRSSLALDQEVMTDASSAANFDLAKSWLEKCMGDHRAHEACGKPEDMPLPTRLLDVGNQHGQEQFLKITEGQKGKYVALSYCWGQSEPFVTTVDSLDQHLKGIPMAKLPKTIQDAIIITRKFGIRYLWVDALCIIQARHKGDEEALKDWQKEGSCMATVYGNSWLTIGAGSAMDKQGGCFTRRRPDYLCCEVVSGEEVPYKGEINSTNVYARLLPSSLEGPLRLRAWTFQEAVLSPRILVYGEAQIMYCCRGGSVLESGRSYEVQSGRLQAYNLTSFFSKWIPSLSRPSEREHILANWYYALELNFSIRMISCEPDLLPAISGLAHRIKQIVGGDYCAGLWRLDMIRGLLWKSQNVVPIGKGRYLTRPAEYRAPSWSWAALNGSIFYGYSDRQNLKWIEQRESYPAKIVSVHLDLVPPICDPMGGVSGGFLEIIAPIKPAKLVRRKDHNRIYERKVLRYSNPQFQYVIDTEDDSLAESDNVVGLCAFDLEDDWPDRLWCLLLSLDEGIILVPKCEELCVFERVGFFILERKEWYLNCEPIKITII